MIIVWLILVPLAGGLIAWYSGKRSASLARYISVLTLALMFGLVMKILLQDSAAIGMNIYGPWILEIKQEWIPQIGAGFHLAVDGLNLLLLLLTVFLGFAAVASSWTEIKERVGLFYLMLLWVLAGIIGVFLSMDLFLFYVFWELMLVPMYFLIVLWGHENRRYAAFKFFLFTQAGGLIMLVGILGLYFIHGRQTGQYTFEYMSLVGTSMGRLTELLLMSCFFIAFAVKLPAVPLHTWLADAHTEAPTAGSVVLAGLLLKTGAYGLIRFALPLFPNASAEVAPGCMVIAVIGVIYGSIMAFAQTDIKRLIAYSSISHMGFVLLGIYAWSEVALQGAIMQIVCHGIATGALFIIAGTIQERTGTRDMGRMGGLWETAPRMGAAALFFALASLGLPGLGNFIGEFMVLLGSYRVNIAIAAIGAAGVVSATVYSLWLIQRVFHGRDVNILKGGDLAAREMAVMAVMMAALIWLGLFPQQIFNISQPALKNLRVADASSGAEILARKGEGDSRGGNFLEGFRQ